MDDLLALPILDELPPLAIRDFLAPLLAEVPKFKGSGENGINLSYKTLLRSRLHVGTYENREDLSPTVSGSIVKRLAMHRETRRRGITNYPGSHSITCLKLTTYF